MKIEREGGKGEGARKGWTEDRARRGKRRGSEEGMD